MKQLMPNYSTARRIDEAAAGLFILAYPEYLNFYPAVACTGTLHQQVGPFTVHQENICV